MPWTKIKITCSPLRGHLVFYIGQLKQAMQVESGKGLLKFMLAGIPIYPRPFRSGPCCQRNENWATLA